MEKKMLMKKINKLFNTSISILSFQLINQLLFYFQSFIMNVAIKFYIADVCHELG